MAFTTQTIPPATGIKNAVLVVQSNSITGIASLGGVGAPGTSTLNLRTIRNFFRRAVVGAFATNVRVMLNGVYASGTAVCSGVSATDTLVIGGVTITCVNSGATSVQFNKGTTDTLTAANIVTTINALSTMNRVVQATSTGTTVTIVSLVPGTIGNLITLSSAGGHITVGAALTLGADGTSTVISHGL